MLHYGSAVPRPTCAFSLLIFRRALVPNSLVGAQILYRLGCGVDIFVVVLSQDRVIVQYAVGVSSRPCAAVST